MVTAIEDLLRLAWRADGYGKPGLRDALLTLAVVDSGNENAVLSERCRRLLVARRPDHWFANTPTLGQAMADPRVAASLERLRATFPPVRVRRHLLRDEVLRGPFTGRSTPLAQILEDLSLADGRRNGYGARALPFPVAGSGRHDHVDPDGALAALYVSVLLAMAVLLKSVLEPASHDSKAA